jgi:hypothetical protein
LLYDRTDAVLGHHRHPSGFLCVRVGAAHNTQNGSTTGN